MLLLVGAMVLIRSGPLPACLLDEALAALLSMSGPPPSEPCTAFHAPAGNDTPDEINRGWSQQHTFGSDGRLSVLAHAPMASVVLMPPPSLVGADGVPGVLRCHLMSTSPPPDHPARCLPLLT